MNPCLCGTIEKKQEIRQGQTACVNRRRSESHSVPEIILSPFYLAWYNHLGSIPTVPNGKEVAYGP